MMNYQLIGLTLAFIHFLLLSLSVTVLVRQTVRAGLASNEGGQIVNVGLSAKVIGIFALADAPFLILSGFYGTWWAPACTAVLLISLRLWLVKSVDGLALRGSATPICLAVLVHVLFTFSTISVGIAGRH